MVGANDNSGSENEDSSTRWYIDLSESESALLTRKQREYLSGESDIEPRSADERSIRSRLRDRLRTSLFDFRLLQQKLESRDVEKVFSEPEIFNYIDSVFALIFDGLGRSSKYNHPSTENEVPSQSVLDMYADLVASGIETLYRSRGFDVENVSVSIDLELGSTIDDIENQELNNLSIDELTLLLQNDRISREQFQDALPGDPVTPNDYDDAEE